MSNKLDKKEEQEEQQEIIQPMAVNRPRFMFDFEETELENPRRILWKWIISYLKPFKGKFIRYMLVDNRWKLI